MFSTNWSKRRLPLLLAVAMLAVTFGAFRPQGRVSPPAEAQTVDRVGTVQQFLAAVTQGNVETALSLTTGGAVWRRDLDGDIGIHTAWTPGTLQTAGSIVFGPASYATDCTEAFGIPQANVYIFANVLGAKVLSLSWQFDFTDAATRSYYELGQPCSAPASSATTPVPAGP